MDQKNKLTKEELKEVMRKNEISGLIRGQMASIKNYDPPIELSDEFMMSHVTNNLIRAAQAKEEEILKVLLDRVFNITIENVALQCPDLSRELRPTGVTYRYQGEIFLVVEREFSMPVVGYASNVEPKSLMATTSFETPYLSYVKDISNVQS